MAYESYKDSNGITWTVMDTANGWTMLASVFDAADPRYDPPATDQMAATPPNALTGAPPTAEQTRVIFTELTAKIEKYARQHRGQAMLKVTAKNDAAWIWLLVILIAAASDG